MFTLIMTMLGIITTLWMCPTQKVWSLSVSQCSILFFLSTILLASPLKGSSELSHSLSSDSISAPLLILSYWLLPVSLLASVAHLSLKSDKKTRLFMTLSLIMLLALTVTFSATKLILFFMGFESTLVPTLLLMTRWGMQEERVEAGYYFVFYTLISSLPLLLALVSVYLDQGHLSIPLFAFQPEKEMSMLLPLFCLVAFLVKVPVFGLHLWLPKAHVEAPVAGSMILAAILLKMGGYGFIRLTTMFIIPFHEYLSYYLVPFCCWGGALTSLICISQTDLKSLMAYSSVSHMSFMIAGISLISGWAITGSMIVMVAHGLVSSALFCMAKVYYERTGTRTLNVSRGMKSLFILLPLLWLLFACANLGLPPFPNAIGELLVFSAMVQHGLTKFMPTLMGVVFTGIFSLMIYQYLNAGSHFSWKLLQTTMKEREMTSLILHLLPLLALMMNPKIISL